jgi:hypothetical protein
LEIIKLKPIYGNDCGTPGVHKIHWCLTFLCKAQGEIQTGEKGRVLWVPWNRLIHDENKKLNSFGAYNLAVQVALSGNISDEWRSNIPLDPTRVFKWPGRSQG